MCSDSGSHDYTINRREAEKKLQLKITKPTEEQYSLIKTLYDDFVDELEMKRRSDFGGQQTFNLKRGLIESCKASYMFITEGTIRTQIKPDGSVNIMHAVSNEGWRKIQ